MSTSTCGVTLIVWSKKPLGACFHTNVCMHVYKGTKLQQSAEYATFSFNSLLWASYMVTGLALTQTFVKDRRKKIMDDKADCKKKKKKTTWSTSLVRVLSKILPSLMKRVISHFKAAEQWMEGVCGSVGWPVSEGRSASCKSGVIGQQRLWWSAKKLR